MKKTIGIAFMVIAALVLVTGFNIDTSVATGYGSRVNNIGLMNQKQNVIILGGVLLIAGALLLGLSGSGSAPTENSEGYRKCSSCAEVVKVEAKICKHCQQPLPSMAELKAQKEEEQAQIAKLREQQATEALWDEENAPKGVCPCCEKTVALASLSCKHCKASFDEWSTWKVKPLT